MDAALRRLCGAAVPGDTYRNLQIQSEYSAQTFKHILVPVWLLTYTYGSTVYHVAANGVTGHLAGERRHRPLHSRRLAIPPRALRFRRNCRKQQKAIPAPRMQG